MDNITGVADDFTCYTGPQECLDAAVLALENRWERGWTGGAISIAVVVLAAADAALKGEPIPLWEDDVNG